MESSTRLPDRGCARRGGVRGARGQDLDAGHEARGTHRGGQAPVADAQAPPRAAGSGRGRGRTAEVGGRHPTTLLTSLSQMMRRRAQVMARARSAGDGVHRTRPQARGVTAAARASERACDKLHGENQRLRAGELRGAMLPLVRDLLRLHDDIGRIADATEQVEDLELMQISLLDALSRNGIVSVRPLRRAVRSQAPQRRERRRGRRCEPRPVDL